MRLLNSHTSALVLFLLLLMTGTLSVPLFGQESDEPPRLERVTFRLGVYGGFGFNQHQTEASVFSGGGECGAFSDGTGNGAIGGILGEFPLLGGMLELTARLTYAQRGGAFGEAFTGGLPILDPNSNEYTTLERRHTYTAQLGYAVTELGVRVMPLREFDIPLYVQAAAGISLPVGGPSYEQNEEIISPQGVLYPETNTTERLVGNGEIIDPEILTGAAGALGYDIEITPRIVVAPEISYFHPFNDVTLAYPWKVSTIQGGVALKWNFGPEAGRPEPPAQPIAVAPRTPPPPPSDPEPPQVAVGIASPEKVEVVETIVTETFPLLPYIFFDSSSTALPARYERMSAAATATFRETDLPPGTLDSYYQILNVIGHRLKKNPEAAIRINGTTDGTEERVPGAADNLARGRAQTVKDYLVDVWDVDPGRINVGTIARPTFPSSMEYSEGAEENRRVEIIADRDNIMQPILHEKFNEYSYEPDQVNFSPQAASAAGIEHWAIDVKAGGKRVWRQEGTGVPSGNIPWMLDQESAARLTEGLKGDGRLQCTLTAVDRNGRSSTSDVELPADISRYPFEVSRLSLVVFDFDKASISSQNRRMISSFVAESIKPTSRMSIVGSTDLLGEMEHNQQLSQGRAVAVRDLVRTQRPDAKIERTEGIGPSRLRYSNSLPEGRYYCRTVTVEVETPLEAEEL